MIKTLNDPGTCLMIISYSRNISNAIITKKDEHHAARVFVHNLATQHPFSRMA